MWKTGEGLRFEGGRVRSFGNEVSFIEGFMALIDSAISTDVRRRDGKLGDKVVRSPGSTSVRASTLTAALGTRPLLTSNGTKASF